MRLRLNYLAKSHMEQRNGVRGRAEVIGQDQCCSQGTVEGQEQGLVENTERNVSTLNPNQLSGNLEVRYQEL